MLRLIAPLYALGTTVAVAVETPVGGTAPRLGALFGGPVLACAVAQYWLAHGGCVEQAGGWTRVTARRAGFMRLTTRFSPERIVSRGRRCNARR